VPFGNFGHRARGLAGGKKDDAAARRRVRKAVNETACRMGGSDRDTVEFIEKGARRFHV
jgi:hypothetical protein